MATIYKIYTREDYASLNKKYPKFIPGFPTVIALRDGEVVGAVATNTDDGVVALDMLIGDSPFIIIQLVYNYEQVLRNLGVTTYFAAISHDLPKWREAVVRKGVVTFVGEDNRYQYFRRDLWLQ